MLKLNIYLLLLTVNTLMTLENFTNLHLFCITKEILKPLSIDNLKSYL